VRALRPGTAAVSVDGTAGNLIGACLLNRRTPDNRLRRAADALGVNLLDRARRRMRRRWQPADATGFLHGWPGVLYALLAWRASNSDHVEGWLVDGLIRLGQEWRADAGVRPSLRGSWCTGAAGATLLWCKAFECTREKAFLHVARESGRAAMGQQPDGMHLCCGSGGIAYALLALERVDPGHGWRARAFTVGNRAITTPLVSRWPNGLLWGHPGLVCLALDLLSDKPRGFPCIEG
jgi:Lanthionine synthetase C-like protein